MTPVVLESSGDLEEKSDIDILTALRYVSICAVSLLAVIMPLLAQRLKFSMKARILCAGYETGVPWGTFQAG